MKSARRCFASAARLALVLPAAAFAADGIHEGLWHYTMKMDMSGMQMPAMPKIDASKLPPGMKLPQMDGHAMTMEFEHCVTNADLVPKRDKDEHCKITRMDRQGSTVNWASVCDTPHGKMNAEGTATYSGDTMQASTHMTGSDDGKPIDMTQQMTGRYVGACAK